jgi:HJR/Mrr/RecB family endonuclease
MMRHAGSSRELASDGSYAPDAMQLWEAVFAAALEEEKLSSLLIYVRDHLGLRPKRQLESALRDIGVTL